MMVRAERNQTPFARSVIAMFGRLSAEIDFHFYG